MFSSINNLLFYVFDPIKKITWYFDNKKNHNLLWHKIFEGSKVVEILYRD
jgi:hypothetical protein